MKKKLLLILIISSSFLIIVNFIFSDKYDGGFWLRTLSSILIILSMVLTIKASKKENKS